MNGSVTKRTIDKPATDLLESFVSIGLLPDEDEESLESLREALVAELSPGRPYERILVEQMVALEWDALRHRRLRDSLLRSEFREQAMGVFEKGEPGRVFQSLRSEETEAFAYGLLSSDPERREVAEHALEEYEITASEILAKAYEAVAKSLEPHERQIAEIEVRRRRLRDDYERLKVSRQRQVEDAEIVEDE